MLKRLQSVFASLRSHDAFTVEIAGSNPAGGTTYHLSLEENPLCGFRLRAVLRSRFVPGFPFRPCIARLEPPAPHTRQNVQRHGETNASGLGLGVSGKGSRLLRPPDAKVPRPALQRPSDR
jgi:hypothetical protein